MRDTYSLYEAKAKLSAIVRWVRDGHRVIVTVHGDPAVEIRPAVANESGLGPRMERLAERGILIRPASRPAQLRPGVRRPGALERFLGDRDG